MTFNSPFDAPAIVLVHLASAMLSLASGTAVLLLVKGTAWHVVLGRIFMIAMLVTAATSFAITSVTPGHYSPIHILSAVTLVTLPRAWLAARRGDAKLHARGMVLNFVGLLLAGSFALMPYRTLGRWLLGA